MRKITIAAIFLAAATSGMLFYGVASACGGWFEPSCDTASGQAQVQQETVAQTMNKLMVQVPAPQLENSLERQNISKRLTVFSDPAKISYIYLVNYGHVMAYYVVKGKITSGGKRLTPQNQIVNTDNGGAPYTQVLESPELDGTYGNSNPYIFFWTTDGVYVQWSGDYMLTDQPLSMSQQPELVRTIK